MASSRITGEHHPVDPSAPAEPADRARPGRPLPPWRRLPADRAPGRWVAPLYLLMALIMLPWVGLLTVSLPDRVVSHNYRMAWVGFDVLLVVSMTRTAWLAWRRSPFVVNVASTTATLLVVDAWF